MVLFTCGYLAGATVTAVGTLLCSRFIFGRR